MKIAIINGPNLNLLGSRETDIYGNMDFETYFLELKALFPKVDLVYKQSNIEGELINFIQEFGFDYQAIIINPGGYSHTSVSIADAIAAVKTTCIEVHISNIYAREDFRAKSITARKCKGQISGLGLLGYQLAIEAILKDNT